MAVGLDLFEDVLDLAVGANDEGGPGNAPDFLAIHVLFLHDAEGLGDFLVGVGEEAEGQVLAFFEFLLGFGRVGRDAEQHGTGLLNLSVGVAEPASFDGSTGSVGFRVEEENDGLAAHIL